MADGAAGGRASPRFRLLVLNQIAAKGLARLPPEHYELGADMAAPDALLVRSADLHAREIAPSVQAIARAGAGTNNIPVDAMSARGVPVFNAPGANANAVKELVLAAMLLTARNLAPALRFVAEGSASGQIMRLSRALIGNSAQKVIDGFFERFAAAMGVEITALDPAC